MTLSNPLPWIAALAALLLGLTPAPAAAQSAAAIDDVPGVHCETQVIPGAKKKNGRRRPPSVVDMCRVPLGLGDSFEAPREDWLPHPDLRGFEVASGDKVLTVRLCADRDVEDSGLPCFDTFRGTKRAQYPSLGFLEDIVTLDPPLSTVGLDTGANLLADDLELPELLYEVLHDDEKYVVYHTQQPGLDGAIPGLDAVGFSAGGDTTTLVRTYTLNPLEGLLFYEGELKGLPFGKGEKKADKKRNKKKARKKGKRKRKQDREEADAPRAQIAYSADPRLPFEPIRTVGVEGRLEAFDGHLLLRGPIPIYKLITLDGTVVANLDPDEDGDHPFESAFYTSFDVQLGGNGAAFVDLPFFTMPDVGLDLGEASVGVRIAEERDGAAITGIVTSEDFLRGIPIPIRQDRTIEAWGYLSASDLAGSYLHLEGRMTVGASGLGELLGLPLGDLASDDAVMDINASGLTLQGTSTRQIHPDILYNQVQLTVHVSPDGRDSYIELRGAMTIAGEGLEDARVRVSPRGMFVNGTWFAGSTEFAMAGEFGARGYVLSGSAAVADPIELNAQESVRLADTILQNEETRALLESQLATARRDLGNAQAAFEDAVRGVDAAQAEVDRIASLIRTEEGRRDSAYRSYRSWVNRSCAWYDAPCQATRSGNISYYYGRYTYHRGVIGTLQLSMDGATAALQTARSVLSPIETTFRNAESLVARLSSQLDALAAAIHDARQRLDALPSIDGALSPVVTATISNGDVSATASARWGRRQVLRGTVDLSDPGEVCFDVPRSGTLCSPL